MALKIRRYGNPVLERISEPVEDFGKKLEKLVEHMEQTLHASGGVGLAAPQVGVSLRLFLASDRERKRLYRIVNPVILEVSGSEIDMEGCLSFPEIYFSIKRAKKVVLAGYTPKGKKMVCEAEGLLARCFLHETDHLDGRLIIDYAAPGEKALWKEKLGSLVAKARS